MNKPYNPKRPKALDDYILKECQPQTYLFYDKAEDYSICSRCGTIKKLSRMNDSDCYFHNREHYCYECKTGAIIKNLNRGRYNIEYHGRILWSVRHGRDTYMELDEFDIDYSKISLMKPIPIIRYYPSALYKFNKDVQIYYKYKPDGFFTDAEWKKYKTPRLPNPYTPYWWQKPRYEDTYIYPDIKVGTDLQYANISKYSRGNWGYYFIRYIDEFLKHPSIEILDKSGLENIVGERLQGRKSRAINWNSNDLRKILKLNNHEIKLLRKYKASIGMVENYKSLDKNIEGLNEDEVMAICRYIGHCDLKYKNYKDVFEFHGFINLKNAIRYLMQQEENGQKIYLKDYSDYLRTCDMVGLSMDDKQVLKPDDFRKADIDVNEQYKMKKKFLDNVNFKKYEALITGMTEPYSDGKYLIRPAACIDELDRESNKLHHCVRTYADKVASGRTSILFIRKVSSPDTPLYTLEMAPGQEFIQCRGKFNCDYPDDVREFIKGWLKWMSKRPKKTKEAA